MERLVDVVTPLGEALWFRQMTGAEAMSGLFEFDVTFQSKQSGMSAKALRVPLLNGIPVGPVGTSASDSVFPAYRRDAGEYYSLATQPYQETHCGKPQGGIQLFGRGGETDRFALHGD